MFSHIKIGIDARPLSYQLTGIGVYLKHLLDEIQTIDTINRYFLISNGPIHYKLANPNWRKIEGRFNRKLLSTFWMQLFVPLIVQKNKIDLFWGPRHHLPVLLMPRVKALLTIHDLVHQIYPETMNLPNLIIERLLMKKSLKRADAVIAVSKSTELDIKKYYRINPDKINTIYSGIPTIFDSNNGLIEHSSTLPEHYFLFVGTFEPRKNFERIFKAFELIRAADYDFHLIVAGRQGWKSHSLIEMIKGHPLKKYIHFTGYISQNRLKQIYLKATCLVFPSLYEGFGFPILEAMSLGVPVITSKISSMPEVAGDAALLVDPNDLESLAEAMKRIIIDKDLCVTLAQNGSRRIKHFSWRNCAVETIKIFKEITNK